MDRITTLRPCLRDYGFSLEGVVELASWIKDDLAASPSPPARGLPPGTVNDVWESTSWLPISTDDGGNHISIDLAPAPLGIFGQLIYVYSKHPDRPRIATSFVEVLDARVQEWETGAAEPIVDDGWLVGVGLRHRWRGE